MKKSLISLSTAMLLATTGTVTLASSVTIPNTFTSGTPAVAAEVNANFDAVATSVNDNDSRVTTNTANITTNTGNITTNAGNINTNTADIATNAADILALQGSTSCPSDMVAVGSICVDMYEASIWDAPTGGNQLGLVAPTPPASAYPCTVTGDDCAVPNANAIYAQSRPGVLPANWVTWYQAVQACANVGKRLPTVAEWQMAALGTPGAPDCNIGGTATAANTDANPACLSPAGVVNMVGNVMEAAADIDWTNAVGGDMDTADVARLGNSYDDVVGGLTTNAVSIAAATTGYGPQTGFRCVK